MTKPRRSADPQGNVEREISRGAAESSELRRRMREARRNIPADRARELSAQASERLAEVLTSKRVERVALYCATDGELDPSKAGEQIRRNGGDLTATCASSDYVSEWKLRNRDGGLRSL